MGEMLCSRRQALSLAAAPLFARTAPRFSAAADAFLDDFSRRCFRYFWERASEGTGLVLDRALNSDRPETRQVASSAATGFGLTALCIAAERRWVEPAAARARALAAVRFYAGHSAHVRGWFYHFVDAASGGRVWNCELSSIDTALLLAGILTARAYFDHAELSRLAAQIYARIDFQWMLNGDRALLSMGWKPESGFIEDRWNRYCELMILVLLGLGSPATPLPPAAWHAWRRPKVTYAGHTYISAAPPLFTHQYSHAWVDFRQRRERDGERVDWFRNSVEATLAHRQFCIDLGKREFPGCYSDGLWGITASDSAKGYVAWGGPPRDGPIDGSLVPCAAAGSLMFAPALCLRALETMRRRFGPRVWGRYGFPDAFHPRNGWTNPDVIGIDLGISLLAAENARTGRVWSWFLRNPEIQRALGVAGLEPFA